LPFAAVLYDRFANALDPFAPERDQAEILGARIVLGSLPVRELDSHHSINQKLWKPKA